MIVAKSTNMGIPDYCAAMDRGEIVVNRSYQRSDKVWPETAKSYLIESVLLGFPIPKFYLHLVVDPKNRKSTKEIVDGQQRSGTIWEFYNDKFPLSSSLDTEELRGLTYSTLPEDWQGRFVSYILSVDQFVGANAADVRQVFRRMNSYTVPLNPEELRHADHQGKFKWFISSLASDYTESLLSYGVFSDKSVVRMQDLKLYTEVACALDLGVTTTSRKHLDNIYRRYDKNFPEEEKFSDLMGFAFKMIAAMPFLKGSNLNRGYQIYSLAVALAEIKNADEKPIKFDQSRLEANILDLSAALELPESEIGLSPHKEFILGSVEKTNVKAQREFRIAAFKAALEGAQLPG